MANFKVEPNKGESGKTNVKVTAESANNDTGNRTLGSVVFTTEDGTQKSVRVFQYGKTVFEVDRPNPMASTDTQVSFIVHSWYHGEYSEVNVYSPVGTVSVGTPSGGDVRVTISGISANPGTTTKVYNIVLTQNQTGNTITLSVAHTAEEQPIPVVHTFSVSPTSLSLEEGELGHLTCYYDNNAISPNLVTFTSSDNNVATTETNGTINALRMGAGEITVVYNNTDPEDGNVYTVHIPIVVRQAQVIPTTCSIVFDITPAGATVKVNNVAISGYTYTATIGTTFTYEISKQGYIGVLGTFTPTENATIRETLVAKTISNITKVSGGTELTYNVPMSSAGVSSNFYPNSFNIPFKVLYNNGDEETGFFVAGSMVNNQWVITRNLPYDVNYSFQFTYINEPTYNIVFDATNGVFKSVPQNTTFSQRTIGKVELCLTTPEKRVISQTNITQSESTQKIISSIAVGTTNKTDISYPLAAAAGETIHPYPYHIPLTVSYTNGTLDSTSYYLDNAGNNLPDGVSTAFSLVGTSLPSTGAIQIEENPSTSVNIIGTLMLSVLYNNGNLLPATSCTITQAPSTFRITGGTTITTGYSTQLTAVFNGVDITSSANWESSNTSIATVSSGEVSALAEGSVVISAEYKDATASKNMTIQATTTLIVTIPSDRTNRYKIGEDDPYLLSVKTSDNQPVSEAVLTHDGNPGDVEIDGYTVSFVNPGTYTITATYNGMTGNITFTAVEITSIALSAERPTLNYGENTRFTAIATYSDTLTSDITMKVTFSVLSGQSYVSWIPYSILVPINWRLLDVNTDQTVALANQNAYIIGKDWVNNEDIVIENTFTGVSPDIIQFGFNYIERSTGIVHNAEVQASYLGVDSNIISLTLGAQSVADINHSGVVNSSTEETIDIETADIIEEYNENTGTYKVLTVYDSTGQIPQPTTGSTVVNIKLDTDVIGSVTIVSIPKACYIALDSGTSATDATKVTTSFTHNPKVDDNLIPRYIYNQTSLPRRLTTDNTGFLRYDDTREYILTKVNVNNLYAEVQNTGIRNYNFVLDGKSAQLVQLVIPTNLAISESNCEYQIKRQHYNESGTETGYSKDHGITIFQTKFAVSNINVENYWYPPISLSWETVSPYYKIQVTYENGLTIILNQTSFDTDFFNHSILYSYLIGFNVSFTMYDQIVYGTYINYDTGVVTLPGTEQYNLANVAIYVTDYPQSYPPIAGGKVTVVGERIQLTFKDENRQEEVVDYDGDNIPDYYIAKYINTDNGTVRFKVYHNGEDVTSYCLPPLITDTTVNNGVPPTASIENGWVCVIQTQQTGYCMLNVRYVVDGLYTGEQSIKLHFAQNCYISDDQGIMHYSEDTPIEPYGYDNTRKVALWADFEGSLVKQLDVANSEPYWICDNTAIATVNWWPSSYVPSDIAIVTEQGVAGDTTLHCIFKNLDITAKVHCE